MCIRDRAKGTFSVQVGAFGSEAAARKLVADLKADGMPAYICLLYTSDAADERSSVDLGGRRIIKKKKK